jgi:hypothetical protein
MKKIAAICLLAVSGIAIACTVQEALVTPMIEVSAYQTAEQQLRYAGDKLEEIYEDQYSDHEIYSLRVPLKVCLFGVCHGTLDVQTLKPCDQTLKERMNELADEVAIPPEQAEAHMG